MNLIDTNGVDYILKHNFHAREEYFVTPDVQSESEITELFHGRKMPSNIRDLNEHRLFDPKTYLQHYKTMLNKYPDKSFFNMTGFGDISILAAIKTVSEKSIRENSEKLFADPENIVVYTEDNNLISEIKKEFGDEVLIKKPTDLV